MENSQLCLSLCSGKATYTVGDAVAHGARSDARELRRAYRVTERFSPKLGVDGKDANHP